MDAPEPAPLTARSAQLRAGGEKCKAVLCRLIVDVVSGTTRCLPSSASILLDTVLGTAAWYA